MATDEQHIHSVFFAPILDTAYDAMSRERIHGVLERLGTSEQALRDATAWVSSELAEQIVEALVEESGDPTLLANASRRLFSGNYIGVLKPMMQFFGSTSSLIAGFPRASPRWNKMGRWVVHALERDQADISFESTIERSPYMCEGRLAQLAELPTLYGLPRATIEHVECMHRGGERCRYLARWEPPPPTSRILVPRLLAGSLALGGLTWVFGAPTLAIAGASAVGAVVGSLAAALRQSQQRTARLNTWMAAQDDALNRSLEANEIRYAELLEAKRSVERQVETRTHELRQTSEQLSTALAEVRQLDELKTRFFANVSHELRTPLQLIMGPLDELAQGADVSPQVVNQVAIMRRNANRLYRLINQLLDLAKADAGQSEATRAPMRLASLVEHLLDAFRGAATARDIQLVGEVASDLRAELDGHWMESALTNLVANAVRHCDAGDTVVVRVFTHDTTLAFEVEDTGPGIPEEDLGRIFDRFAQSEQKEGAARGTGIGLSIVQEAARLHGGEATVSSVVGQGTTFRLAMPWVRVANDAQDEALFETPTDLPVAPAQDDHPVTFVDGPTADAPLAVIAEDEPDLRAYVANTLAARFRVVACADGALAWEEIRKRGPDVVVSDRSMPNLTGTELCRAIREDPATAAIPVVLLTARQTTDDVLDGYDAGADDYVAKPFHPRELMARVDVQLRLRRLSQRAAMRERMASVGMLSAEIAHHFRNPLNFIKSGLTVIRRRLDTEWLERNQSFWATLEESSGRIEVLTQDLLRLSESRDGAPVALFNPADSIRTAARLTRTTVPPDVSIEVAHVAEARLLGRSGKFDQVMLNLIGNAAQTLHHGGRVRVSAFVDAEEYVIVVEDSGSGVPPELREHLFDAHVSTQSHQDGAGLELAIAAKLIRDHQGTIRVGTSPDLGGACFHVAMPLADVLEPA